MEVKGGHCVPRPLYHMFTLVSASSAVHKDLKVAAKSKAPHEYFVDMARGMMNFESC